MNRPRKTLLDVLADHFPELTVAAIILGFFGLVALMIVLDTIRGVVR